MKFLQNGGNHITAIVAVKIEIIGIILSLFIMPLLMPFSHYNWKENIFLISVDCV